MARYKLQELKHTDTIRKYVKQFVGLMLDIQVMPKKDKFLVLSKGERHGPRQSYMDKRVQSLLEAYISTEELFDLSNDMPQEQRRNQTSSNGGNKSTRCGSAKSCGGDKAGGVDCKPFQPRGIYQRCAPNQHHNNYWGGSFSYFLCKGTPSSV